MTSAEWKEVAEAFDTPPERRTERQRGIAAYGLCYAYRTFGSNPTRGFFRALRRFCGRKAFGWGDYLEPLWTPQGDILRAGLAALFAAMNQKERDEVLGRF